MARKRKKRGRSFNAAPLLIVALICAGLLALGIWPRHRHGENAAPNAPAGAHRVAQASPAAPAQPQSPAAASPAPSPTPQAVATATATPAATPSPVPTATPTMNPNGPEVALIIDDCGQWLSTEQGVIALPIPITLSVLPDVHYTARIAQEAGDAGKGVMLHLPMEPISHINPGPGEIKVSMDDAAIAKMMEDDIAQVPLAKGLNNHEGSEATADPRVMKDVMAIVKAHGLFFIDSRTSAKSVAAQEAADAGVPTASRDVFLDNQASVAYTSSMLEHAVAVAKAHGSAIAIGHPKPTTLEAIREMYPKMEAQGVRFVLAQSLTH